MVALKQQFCSTLNLTLTVKKRVDENLVLAFIELQNQPTFLVKCSHTFFYSSFFSPGFIQMPMGNN